MFIEYVVEEKQDEVDNEVNLIAQNSYLEYHVYNGQTNENELNLPTILLQHFLVLSLLFFIIKW